MPRTIGLLLCFSEALAGCTAVSTKMVSADTALISASDDEASVPEAHKAAILVAAKIARKRGYEYFRIIDERDTDGTEWQYSHAGPIGSGNPGSAGTTISRTGQDLTVRFLHRNELTANRTAIYPVAAVLAGRLIPLS